MSTRATSNSYHEIQRSLMAIAYRYPRLSSRLGVWLKCKPLVAEGVEPQAPDSWLIGFVSALGKLWEGFCYVGGRSPR
ncbi:MAG: hypothetical protein AAFY26_12595 [Cyanobacteria bacterium J06638_22]